MNANDEFYVGYQPQPPPGVGRLVRRAVALLLAGTTALALLLVFSQSPFPNAMFDFGQPKQLTGVIRSTPVPSVDSSDRSRALLVAPGKHGAADLVQPFTERSVEFEGTRIERDGVRMFELTPGSLKASGAAVPDIEWTPLGDTELRGEIADSKCYLGVMNPGQGKVHKACAARCISGGIPPALIARDREGKSGLVLVTGPNGRPIGRELLDFAGEPVIVKGRLFRARNQLRIETLPEGVKRPDE